MFTRFWIAYTIIGLAVAVLVFRWAVHSRQFEDSRRAALLPFDDIEPDEPEERVETRAGEKGRKAHLAILFSLAVFGLLVTLIVILIAVSSGPAGEL